MLVVVVCREKKEVSNEIALFYVACGFIDGSASGCSNRATATISPGTDLNRLKTFYLVHPPKDTHNIHNLSRDKLTKDGFTATAGPELPQSSNQADSIITYVDRWMWDITLYLLELTVTLRDPSNDFPLAVGNSFHTSLNRKSPARNRRRRKEQRSTGLEQSSKTQSLIPE